MAAIRMIRGRNNRTSGKDSSIYYIISLFLDSISVYRIDVFVFSFFFSFFLRGVCIDPTSEKSMGYGRITIGIQKAHMHAQNESIFALVQEEVKKKKKNKE